MCYVTKTITTQIFNNAEDSQPCTAATSVRVYDLSSRRLIFCENAILNVCTFLLAMCAAYKCWKDTNGQVIPRSSTKSENRIIFSIQ